MALPLVLTWDKNKISKSGFLHQLYVGERDDHYLGMAQSIGMFRSPSSNRINILRSHESGNESYYFTQFWSIVKGTPDVYKPLPTRGVK